MIVAMVAPCRLRSISITQACFEPPRLDLADRRGASFLVFLRRVAATCPSQKSYPRVAMMQPRQNGHSNNGCPYRKSNPNVLVVQASEERLGDDAANSLDGARN